LTASREGDDMADVTFGLFDWIDRGAAPVQQVGLVG
jgi:hypothetical protein